VRQPSSLSPQTAAGRCTLWEPGVSASLRGAARGQGLGVPVVQHDSRLRTACWTRGAASGPRRVTVRVRSAPRTHRPGHVLRAISGGPARDPVTVAVGLASRERLHARGRGLDHRDLRRPIRLRRDSVQPPDVRWPGVLVSPGRSFHSRAVGSILRVTTVLAALSSSPRSIERETETWGERCR